MLDPLLDPPALPFKCVVQAREFFLRPTAMDTIYHVFCSVVSCRRNSGERVKALLRVTTEDPIQTLL